MSERTPIPVHELVDSAVDDGSTYHDGLDAYLSSSFDRETGVLTIGFNRASEEENGYGDDWGDATYQFKLVAGENDAAERGPAMIRVSDVRTAVEYEREYGGGDDFIQVMRDFLSLAPAARAAKVAEWDARFARDDV